MLFMFHALPNGIGVASFHTQLQVTDRGISYQWACPFVGSQLLMRCCCVIVMSFCSREGC